MNINRDQDICIVGCGGVGMNVAIQLALAGIKSLLLFDPDLIEEHNLNRLPIPYKCIGMNKAYVCKEMIKQMRPNCDITCFKSRFDEIHVEIVDWIVDCTDSFSTQKKISSFSEENNIKYCKLGYDGERMSINNKIAPDMWNLDEGDDQGYQITPSWTVPSNIVASLGVAKIMKYENIEMGCELKNLYH